MQLWLAAAVGRRKSPWAGTHQRSAFLDTLMRSPSSIVAAAPEWDYFNARLHVALRGPCRPRTL